MTLSARNTGRRTINAQLRRGSKAESAYRIRAGARALRPEEIARDIGPSPDHDLIYHGGLTLAALAYKNFYVGGRDAWAVSDLENIDRALAAAMSDVGLNNVMCQYFTRMPTCVAAPSEILAGPPPVLVNKADVEALVASLKTQGRLDGFDLGSTVFNLLLPSGTVLTDDAMGNSEHHVPPSSAREEAARSPEGLGGYHGSTHTGGVTAYYAVGVYAETRNGQTNGIDAFGTPWKNVVATFYHELNEARTDADVEEANNQGKDNLLGWVSSEGEECGDYPIFEAADLALVFKEVPLANGTGTVPIQFQYSNQVHGPEGPVSTPYPFFHGQ
jgi:hypothetical protein